MQIGLVRLGMIVLAARMGAALSPLRGRTGRALHIGSKRRSTDDLPDIRGRPLKLGITDVDGVLRDMNVLDTAGGKKAPPLLLLAGTAQTIGTYAGHVRELSRGDRRLIIPELRCQGATELLPEYANIEQHTRDLLQLLDRLGLEKVDLVGFSFGGRVALSVAAKHPSRIKSLSITGVPLNRTSLGTLILESWRDGLSQTVPQMRACAWSFILNGYSASFVERYSDKMTSVVDQIVAANDPLKLATLIAQSHIADDSHPFSVPSCAAQIACRTQVISAGEDRIAAPHTVKQLADAISGVSEYVEIPNAGHLVPFEQPTAWRKALIRFLDQGN